MQDTFVRFTTSFINGKDVIFPVPCGRTMSKILLHFAVGGPVLPVHGPALKVFTRVLAPALSLLHSHGIHIVRYLDDLLLSKQLARDLLDNKALAVLTSQQFRWLLSLQNPALNPIHHSGFWSSPGHRVFLLQEIL